MKVQLLEAGARLAQPGLVAIFTPLQPAGCVAVIVVAVAAPVLVIVKTSVVSPSAARICGVLAAGDIEMVVVCGAAVTVTVVAAACP